MKKIKKISYCYFATGIILSLFLMLSQESQSLNIGDTYYVASANDSAIFVSLIYLIFGTIFLVIEKYIIAAIKVLQFILFNIPFIYFLLSDLFHSNNPRYYLSNPNLYEWTEIYIPSILIVCFLKSIVIFFALFALAFWKKIRKSKASI